MALLQSPVMGLASGGQARSGRAGAPPRREQAVRVAPGELVTYDLSWSSYLTAGTAIVSVKEKKPSYGSTAYYIVAEGRPTPLLAKLYSLYYKADTLLDSYTLLPQRGSIYSDENGRHRMKVTEFDQAARKARYEVQTATLVRNQLTVPAYVQDALSALYVIRTLGLKPGEKVTMPICDNGKAFKVQFQAGAIERVATATGTGQALKIVPTGVGPGPSLGRGVAIWISTDARRVPVRLESALAVGQFVLVLRH